MSSNRSSPILPGSDRDTCGFVPVVEEIVCMPPIGAGSGASVPAVADVGRRSNPFDAGVGRVTLSPKYGAIIRPAQSGKTRTIQEMMLEYEEMAKLFHPEEASGFINIVICSKNLNLVKQTHARMSEIVVPSDEEDDDDDATVDATIEGDIFSWMTGTKETNIKPDALAFRIATCDVRMVICCAHKKRLQYVADLLALFDRADFMPRRVNVWMDEADDYVNLWSEVDLARFRKVCHVYLVSATIDDIVDKHTRLAVKGWKTTHPPVYRKTADSIVKIVDTDSHDAVAYFETVYTAHRSELRVPGMRLFAPGSDLVASHNAIADFLVPEGFAVAVINGRRKCILVPGLGKELSIAAHVPVGTVMEIGKVIAKMYVDYNLARFPFAITGKLCLGRGITFQGEVTTSVPTVGEDGGVAVVTDHYEFLFDAGVIPHMNKPSTLYQCAARMNGNTGGFKTYKPSVLYTTPANYASILKSEKIATNLAVLVHTHKLTDIGREEMEWAAHGDEDQYHRDVAAAALPPVAPTAADDSKFEVEWRDFETFAEAKSYASRIHEPVFRDDDGFILSGKSGKAKRLSYASVVSMRTGKKTAGFDVRTPAVGKSKTTLYTCYRSLSDQASVVFVVGKITLLPPPASGD
jgi:hypothetical protein